MLALASGAWIGELSALRWQDIDLHRKTLRIERSGGWIAGECRIHAEDEIGDTGSSPELACSK